MGPITTGRIYSILVACTARGCFLNKDPKVKFSLARGSISSIIRSLFLYVRVTRTLIKLGNYKIMCGVHLEIRGVPA